MQRIGTAAGVLLAAFVAIACSGVNEPANRPAAPLPKKQFLDPPTLKNRQPGDPSVSAVVDGIRVEASSASFGDFHKNSRSTSKHRRAFISVHIVPVDGESHLIWHWQNPRVISGVRLSDNLGKVIPIDPEGFNDRNAPHLDIEINTPATAVLQFLGSPSPMAAFMTLKLPVEGSRGKFYTIVFPRNIWEDGTDGKVLKLGQ